MSDILTLMLLVPLLGSVLNGLVLRPPYPRRAGMVATFASAFSFACAVILFFQVKSQGPVDVSWDWFSAGELQLKWGFHFDSLTSVMALVITGIGTLIHFYSIGYMSEERGPYRYFAYLNLFLFNMLVLVTSDNLVGLFVGWEGVGLCSYLLIGYWFTDPAKAAAGMKAFIVNRIGDAGFLLGMFLCYQLFGSLTFSGINSSIQTHSNINLHLMNVAALLLFFGATGKSAQIPLFVWLPDAMAGPTPVSALIHAATMVTAGVYLIVRMSSLFVTTTDTNLVIAYIGLGTALLAGLIATSQKDIKKVLAYSTVSQLGFMFLALGCRAYVAAIFHLVTHAFFKALLFLGAGSVIHGLGGEQDITKMGGLKAKLPSTFATFAIGTIAIAGIPPLSGFFSKDTILHAALETDVRLWVGAVIAAALTAFYMSRLLALTFLGSYRGEAHAHESPPVMLVPLYVLAIGSALAGFLSVPTEWHLIPNYLENFLQPVVRIYEGVEPAISSSVSLAITLAITIGIFALGLLFYSNPKRAEKVSRPMRPLRMVFANKFWVDELYQIVFVKPFEWLSAFLAKIFDPKLVDGSLMLSARLVKRAGGVVAWFQWGPVQYYLLVMLLGALYLAWAIFKTGVVG